MNMLPKIQVCFAPNLAEILNRIDSENEQAGQEESYDIVGPTRLENVDCEQCDGGEIECVKCNGEGVGEECMMCHEGHYRKFVMRRKRKVRSKIKSAR